MKTKRIEAKLLELIEYVVISRLSGLSKEEVRVMLGLNDYKKSRFYQEARQDGIDEGIEKGRQDELQENIRKMASKGFDAKQISDVLDIDVKIVRKNLKK